MSLWSSLFCLVRDAYEHTNLNFPDNPDNPCQLHQATALAVERRDPDLKRHAPPCTQHSPFVDRLSSTSQLIGCRDRLDGSMDLSSTLLRLLDHACHRSSSGEGSRALQSNLPPPRLINGFPLTWSAWHFRWKRLARYIHKRRGSNTRARMPEHFLDTSKPFS